MASLVWFAVEKNAQLRFYLLSRVPFVFQAMRTLSWKPHLGSVTLDVELEDRVLTNLTVSPIQAATIMYFQEKSKNFHV